MRPTREQQELADFVPPPGALVRGNARAGSGKTTMAALLCDTIRKREPHAKILYLVFGKPNEEDAKASQKFGPHVTIKTTHAFAKQRVVGRDRTLGDLSVKDVILNLSLERQVGAAMQMHADKLPGPWVSQTVTGLRIFPQVGL
jgi:hypothetical protein